MKSKKRILVVIVLLIIFIGVLVFAINKIAIRRVWIGDYNCDIYLKLRKVDLFGYRGTEEEIHIPEKIGPFEVCYLGRTYSGNEYVKRFYIPKKQYENDVMAKDCKNLEEVICEDGLVELNYDFGNCKKLRYVELPDSLEVIIFRAFEGCSSLEDIKIPKNGKLIEIGANAFNKTAFEQKHKNEKYYAAGDNILIFNNVQTDEEMVIPQGIKRDCGRINYTVEKADVYCPDSLLVADYIIEPDATLYLGGEDFQEIKIKGDEMNGTGTVVAPENSPIAKYCKENGINFRPITEEEDAIRRQKTEAAAADVVYQED